MKRSCCLVLLLAAACGDVVSSRVPGTPDAPADPDDPDSAPLPTGRCDRNAEFATPTLVPNVNTAADEVTFTFTGDELLAFGDGPNEIFSLTRANLDSAFGPPAGIDLMPDGFGLELAPQVTFDGLGLYFLLFSNEDFGKYPTFVKRANRGDAFDPDAVIGVTLDNSAQWGQLEIKISRDGATLYWQDFNSHRLMAASGGDNKFTTRRFASTMKVANIVLSADELTLFYTDESGALQFATRGSLVEEFDARASLAGIDSPDTDLPVAITDDGCILYLASARPGGFGGMDLWQAVKPL